MKVPGNPGQGNKGTKPRQLRAWQEFLLQHLHILFHNIQPLTLPFLSHLPPLPPPIIHVIV